MVTTPGTATSTRGLSPGVWKIVGSPISTTTAATASGIECGANAHGLATQAINSVVNRRAEETRLSGDICLVTAERCHADGRSRS